MIYATKDDINRCKTIVDSELQKAGQALDDDVLYKVVEDIMNISYAKGGDYSEKVIRSFVEVYIEHKLYKSIITKIGIKTIIDNWDPIGLFPDAPDDEYDSEILMVQQYIKDCNGMIDQDKLGEKIKEIFETQFGSDVFAYVVDYCPVIAEIILYKVIDKLTVAKILQTATFMFSRFRYQVQRKSTRDILEALSIFFAQSVWQWQYDDLLQVIKSVKSFDNFGEFKVTNAFLTKEITPTDNIKQIVNYSILMSKICEHGCKLYDEMKYDQLFDLLDLVHGLPEALLYKRSWNSKSYWKTYFKPYRRKWDKHFMKPEQKMLGYR